ncbi:hypothetical protein PTSG_07642 [Salpingoeca rosetta]|uniref:Sulfotransferase domain-containing protein n=1 Tax=Salpingoeca rosetta (strain ATCC 50818 / BSB-021) TaxID=946362 RepID=F2UHC6_SALR5|nr:uncharacterized protein PTSG_07642 [Salpingoeca rosetta]EGD76525.1 hypothetical protein PTSG_07642 [Salpingoeca rosetta]|eukprot:XP_004991439.1 hypothetical protein PTSG_07642 [Salpingoeca rosetta]
MLALQVLAAVTLVALFFAWRVTQQQGPHIQDESMFAISVRSAAEQLPKWKTITSEGNPARVSRNAPRTVYGIHRLVLATVPRTGNGWMRGLLEGATGVATESVFKEGVQSVFRERSQAFGKGCGWLEDCNLVRTSAGIDPVVVKVIMYQLEKVAEEERVYMDLPSFMQAWVMHHTFWHNLRVPMFVYRYEDLLANPIVILRTVLKSSGLWDYYRLSDVELARVANLPRLQTFKSKRFGASTKQKDDVAHAYHKYDAKDIEWILDNYRSILDLFGYTGMYEVWLQAARGELTDDDEISVMVQRAMLKTARTSNWGDVYTFDDAYFGL